MITPRHISVLLNEVLAAFADKPLRYFVDATLGAGGHSAAILDAHPEIERLIGIEQDPYALGIARQRLAPWSAKTIFILDNFEFLARHLMEHDITKVDGILLDLGVSSMQLDTPERGFSFQYDTPLDMRMDPLAPTTAADIINNWPEHELGLVIRDYGEEPQWKAATRAIVKAREEQSIKTTKELADLLRPILRITRKRGLEPATLVFQALRICVNRELEVLEAVLPQGIRLLSTEGRFAVISFHSLEDRIVKQFFRFEASDKQDTRGDRGVFIDKEPTVTVITRKPIVPSLAEIQNNPRSRSAKMRIVEKL